MGGTRGTQGGEESFIQVVAGESYGNGTTWKTKALMGRYY